MLAILRHRFKQDALPLLLYLLTFIVMSYPFVLQMGTHLPMDNVDTHTALWQNWWVLEAVREGYDVNYSPLLFYPDGLDVTLQPRRWASLPVWMPLYWLFGDPLAFNLTAMLGVLFKAYGMYLVGLHLFGQRIPAWVTGAFYAFAATSLQMALQQPNTGATEWIPWFMLAFMVGVSSIRGKASHQQVIGLMVLAGFLFAMNAYMNLKIALFAMLLGGGYIALAMVAHGLWRFRVFWVAMIVFGMSALVFSAPMLAPALQSSELADAVGDGVVWTGGVDIESYIKAQHKRPINYMQSIASLRGEQLELQNIDGMSHVGIVGVAFALMGVWYGVRVKRSDLLWLVLAVVFWALSLGLEISFRDEVVWFGDRTPYGLVQDIIVFQILKFPWRMSLVFLFPFSILIGYGLHYRLRTIRWTRLQMGLMVLAVVMLLYGTSIFPIPTRPAPRSDYVDVLADAPDGAVIDIPFGRHNAKYYMSVQRFHGRPMIEGMIARIPLDAFDYIDANPILGAIREGTAFVPTDAMWRGGMQQLLDDGFRYVILHKIVPQALTRAERPDRWVVDLFAAYSPLYEDDIVLIYDLFDLLES